MSFLFPLFLLAGLALAIPLLIHLFNLRRYKTVYFPNTRFLHNIQLHSQKQSQLRYKWLLLLRILFLIFLILAFAQPFFNKGGTENTSDRLQIIYIDNSGSMSVKKGARNLLEIAKEAARKQVQNAPPDARYLLLTNDKPVSYHAMPPEKALAALQKIDISPAPQKAAQVFTTVQSLVQSEASSEADLYYYSDFQQNNFPVQPQGLPLTKIHFYGMPVRAEATGNIFIDTAFLASPAVQSGQTNRLIVKSRLAGKKPDETPILQLSINGQVKTAAGIDFRGNESMDTLSFQTNDDGWQKMTLTINDAAVRFDDTFRIAARSASNLSVLVINQNQPNPYIQAAFQSYEGFRADNYSLNENKDWNTYNLILLNGITDIDDALGQEIATALQRGQSVCIFPGKVSDFNSLNDGLRKFSDIRITGMDTAAQAAGNLQIGSELVRDLFERIPQNVQLPLANWHYIVRAGLSANQQSILSFRNGDPFFAQYTPSRGKLYLLATGADIASGNFPGSYFFVPFLYQMAAQAKRGDVYALTAGRQQPVFLPMTAANERNMVHVQGNGRDAIPPQKPSGAGLHVFISDVVQQPGFYNLTATGMDTTIVALNQSRDESELALWNLDRLQQRWKGADIRWRNISAGGSENGGAASFPLWKVCVILALLMLAAESFLLTGSLRKSRNFGTSSPQ